MYIYKPDIVARTKIPGHSFVHTSFTLKFVPPAIFISVQTLLCPLIYFQGRWNRLITILFIFSFLVPATTAVLGRWFGIARILHAPFAYTTVILMGYFGGIHQSIEAIMIGGFLVWNVIYWAIMGAGLSDPLKRMLEILDHVKSGKLDSRIVLNFPRRDELGRVTEGINVMLDTLEEVAINVKSMVKQVATESHRLMKSVEQMSQGASEQSAAAEETAASMEQMAVNIRQNTENAHTAEQIASQSAKEARQGGFSVSKTVDAMNNIENRVSLIQQIAFQTHILSMNATIEAAKAQDYGKGFAVVASEVRALAGRSREAADEIESLVKSSVTVSAEAGGILQRLVPNSEKTAMLIQEIRAASVEQQGGTEQINTAIQQLDAVIQQNDQRAEEMAVMAEKLATQAEKLQQLIAFFTVRERGPKLPDKQS